MLRINIKPAFSNTLNAHMYKCWKEMIHIDTVFEVRSRNIGAHMVVLSASSEFFYENVNNLGPLFSQYNDDVIDAMLMYCYTGGICISMENIDKFCEFAKILKIDYIEESVTAFENHSIDIYNCLNVLNLSKNNPSRRVEAMRIIVQNFMNLSSTPQFLALPIANVYEILRSNYLNVHSEEDVFKAMKLWIDHDTQNRHNHCGDLLRTVRLKLMTIRYIVAVVLPYCTKSMHCVKYINEILIILTNPNPPADDEVDRLRKGKSKLIVIGNNGADTGMNYVETYDAQSNIWECSKAYKINRFNFGSVLVNDWLLIVGGYNSTQKLRLKTVDYIDLTSGRKFSLKPLNVPRASFPLVAVSCDDYSIDVFAIGGRTNTDVTKTVEKWNTKTQKWSTNVAPMPVEVSLHSAALMLGKIYVTGGVKSLDDPKKRKRCLNDVQIYDTNLDLWTIGTPMSHARAVHTSAVIKGSLFVVGGCTGVYGTSCDFDGVERFDPYSGSWTSFCTLPNPQLGCSLCYFEDKFIFIGGEMESNHTKDVYQYNEIERTWKTLGSLNSGRRGASVFVVPYSAVL